MATTVNEGVGPPEPPWWRDRTRAAPRDRLSREAIIETAIRILDVEGVGAVTVRRLAQELGTGPASLYWHVAGKDQLFELVYDHIMGEIELPEPDPAHWQDQIKALGRAGYDVMVRHNDIVIVSLGMIPLGPNMLRLIEWQLAVLRGAGIPDDIAGYFGDLLGRYIDASVLEETRTTSLQRKGDLDRQQDAEKLSMIGGYIASLPAATYPNIVEVADTMFEGDAASRFELGLDILVRGLAAHIAAT